MYYFNRVLPSHSRIFDGCAGTGNYAFELARRGNAVIASDIVPRNVDIMRQKQMQKPLLDDIFVGDICEMNPYEDHSFDVVLCMGGILPSGRKGPEHGSGAMSAVIEKERGFSYFLY